MEMIKKDPWSLVISFFTGFQFFIIIFISSYWLLDDVVGEISIPDLRCFTLLYCY